METRSLETAAVIDPEDVETMLSSVHVEKDIWDTVTGMIEKALKCRGQDREIDFQEYLDVADTITLGELMLCLNTEDDLHLEIVNEWVDELESNRLDATDVLDE